MNWKLRIQETSYPTAKGVDVSYEIRAVNDNCKTFVYEGRYWFNEPERAKTALAAMQEKQTPEWTPENNPLWRLVYGGVSKPINILNPVRQI